MLTVFTFMIIFYLLNNFWAPPSSLHSFELKYKSRNEFLISFGSERIYVGLRVTSCASSFFQPVEIKHPDIHNRMEGTHTRVPVDSSCNHAVLRYYICLLAYVSRLPIDHSSIDPFASLLSASWLVTRIHEGKR